MSKPQRRKGNAKAASSAHAAHLLASSGQAVPFIGFDGGFNNVFEAVETECSNEIENEIVLILKKLSKKDPQTREKALRDLLSVLATKDGGMLELCYAYYASIYDRLSMDGSPTVRVLSTKVCSFLIAKLKKAAEKHLKKIVPYVLFATSDGSGAVVSQADSLLNGCFPDGKSKKVISLFSGPTATLAVEILSQKHSLVEPQKYDAEETNTQRELRLSIQCLQVLSKLASIGDETSDISSVLQDLFKDSVTVKKLLKSTPSVQSALLSVALHLTDSVQTIVDSPLALFIVNSMDSLDAAIGKAAFTAFMQLAHEDRFYAKIDLKKAIIPKVLNVVRKKLGHWNHCSTFLLPTMAVILDRLDSDADKLGFVTAFLESFLDQMPFEMTSLIPLWSTSLAECVKCALTKLPGEKTAEKCSALLISAIDTAEGESEEVQVSLVDLVHWICAKAAFQPHQLAHFIDLLQLNLINKRPSTDRLLSLLFAPSSWELRHLHVGVLRVPPIISSFLSPLTSCSDEYFRYVAKELDLVRAICSHQPALRGGEECGVAAAVVVRALEDGYRDQTVLRTADANLKHCLLAAASRASDKVWQLVKPAESKEQYHETLAAWLNDGDIESTLSLLKRLSLEERADSILAVIEECPASQVTFLVQCLNGVEWDDHTREELPQRIFFSLFDVSNEQAEPTVCEVVGCLEQFPPRSEDIAQVVPDLVDADGGHSKVLRRTREGLSNACVEKISGVISRLLHVDSVYEQLLVSTEGLESWLREMDTILMKEELPVLTALFSSGEEKSLDESLRSDEKLRSVMSASVLRTMIYAPIDISDLSPAVAERHLASLAVQGAVGGRMGEVDPFFDLTTEHGRRCDDMSTRCMEVVGKDSAVMMAIRGLLACDLQSSTVLYTLRVLVDRFPEAVGNVQEELRARSDMPLPVTWALRKSAQRQNAETAVERWISRYHSEEYQKPFDFLMHLNEFVTTNSPEWETLLFSASGCETDFWKLSVVCLQAARDAFERSEVSAEGRDFIMCGLVTAFDTCDELCATDLPTTLPLSSLLTSAFRLFSCCAELASDVSADEDFKTEWNEFFFPTLSRIVWRLWTFVKPTSGTNPLIRELCTAVSMVPELSTDLGLRETFTPELDLLKYDPGLQTFIGSTVDCVKSDNKCVQLTALRALRLLAPVMYRHENGVWTEEGDKISLDGPRKVLIPFVLHRLMMETRGMPAILAFDAALRPLTHLIVLDEERVAYCDTFAVVVAQVLPQLISACPEEEELSREQREKFFIVEDLACDTMDSASVVMNRYKCSLLYRTLWLIPAVVRTWYNGLPNNAATIVNKYVKKMCSRSLVSDELETVKKTNREQLKNDQQLKIRVVPTTGEVVAEYTVDETAMRLSITMAPDYPLSVPIITLDKAIVTSERAKKWLLQLTAYLFHQNGPTVDGILMWRKNVDREVEGAEECTICMMTVHSTTYQLPRMKCRHCKNKFHSTCLYKWFSTSVQPSCPLCRTIFNIK